MAPTKRKATMAPAPGAMGAPKQKLKQGSLFTFFAKKPEKGRTATASSTAAAMTKDSSNNNANKSPAKAAAAPLLDPEIAQVTVGSYIEVYWENDGVYYKARVEKQRGPSDFHIKYTVDGSTQWVDLTDQRFRRITDTTSTTCSTTSMSDNNNNNNNNNKRRRQILQDDYDEKSEEEFEFDDAASEGSVYKQDNDEDDDDDDEEEDQWLASDDEDEQEISNKSNKKKKKPSKVRKLVVTGHEVSSAISSSTARPLSALAAKKTPHKSASSTSTASAQRTPRQITPALSAAGGTGSASLATTSNRNYNGQQSQSTVCSPPFTPAASTTSGADSKQQQQGAPGAAAAAAVPMYEKGVVNPVGSHVHNHLKFLQQPRDAQGRPTDHPDYDARTLKVNVQEWEKHGKMTDAVKQWWDLKAQYYDTVLLFKTGKFYEMFHMDADVGVDVCGLSYMKGHPAHAGFPEISYGPMADKLVRAGYKVARVEQTETPQMLQERKKKCSRGNVPKVVNREVCSIMTLGTRTFCYLDDQTGILAETATDGNASSAIGPLLVIREILLDTSSNDDKMDVDGDHENDDDDDDQVQPVAEYGITVVDAVRGEISIGQFADDCLRSRMGTLLATFNPSEIILQGGENGASPTLQSLIQSAQQTSPHPCRLEVIQQIEAFPNSTATDADIRRRMQRKKSQIQPWDVQETLGEIHRRKYYSAASKKHQQEPQDGQSSVSRWPHVLRAAVEGNAELALSSFGAALFYLQRNLIDAEILSMQKVKAYIPPTSSVVADESVNEIRLIAEEQNRQDSAIVVEEGGTGNVGAALSQALADSTRSVAFNEGDINHLALDGTTVRNLELLYNTADNKVNGSLWSKIDHTVTPSGRRLLRAWLLRPLFRKADIDRRADAVEELASGAAAIAADKARSVLSKCGDIERLLSRVHTMSGTGEATPDDEEGGPRIHPNDRAILYEMSTYTKRMVGDFSKLLKGLEQASQVPDMFSDVAIQSELLQKIVRPIEQGGCFPDMGTALKYFSDNFKLSKNGLFEPSLGVDELYDDACARIARIEGELNAYKNEMCSNFLRPSSQARSTWKYANTEPNSKDKYMIELPASVAVPNDFLCKGKRGSGNKQINKYRTSVVEGLVQDLERALDIKSERKALGMELFFAKFDSMRDLWGSAAQAVSLLDALCSLSTVASKPGYCRPTILECPPDAEPSINVVQGRHPCVEGSTPDSSDFVPNDLSLGTESSAERVLLLSGPNMGGKSTLLRQTCLIAILAQIGCSVPADQCTLTPIDRIFTRLGATDRILMGQSTFFVELAETAAALRGATRRSLVIMDELGRGTSTFDGTALASAAVKHLVERSKCLSLFATHYHSLLTEWKEHRMVRLGHMECIVGNSEEATSSEKDEADHDITFLYTLGEGTCPKSFGINVARLAGLPEGVLQKAKRISSDFEQEMNSGASSSKITARTAPAMKQQLYEAIHNNDWEKVQEIWKSLQ